MGCAIDENVRTGKKEREKEENDVETSKFDSSHAYEDRHKEQKGRKKK